MSHQPNHISAGTPEEARVPARVEPPRERLLAVKCTEFPWPEVNAWRREIQREFEGASTRIKSAEHPGYEAADGFMLKDSRQRAIAG